MFSERLSRRELIGASAGIAAVAASPLAAQLPAEVDVSRLVRTALFVSDLEASKRFYRDLLGLDEVFFEGEFKGDMLGQLLGIPANAPTRVIILKAEGAPFGMIGLFQVTGHKLRRVRKRRGSVNIGEGVLVFNAARLDPIVAKLRAGGFTIVSPPVNLTPRWREMTFYGPDDVLINLIERPDR